MKNNIKKAPVKFREDLLYFQHFMLIFVFAQISDYHHLKLYKSVCTIQFIESAHFKYGIYKYREVEHQIRKLVRKSARVSLCDVQPPEVYKSHS